MRPRQETAKRNTLKLNYKVNLSMFGKPSANWLFQNIP